MVLAQLTPTERSIVFDHYGLTDDGNTKTLEQLAGKLGLSKERVRQLEQPGFAATVCTLVTLDPAGSGCSKHAAHTKIQLIVTS